MSSIYKEISEKYKEELNGLDEDTKKELLELLLEEEKKERKEKHKNTSKNTLKNKYNLARRNSTLKMGKGAFGSVYKVIHNNKPYALKRVIFDKNANKENNLKESFPESFNSEVAVLKALKNAPYIAKLHNTYKTATNGYMLMNILEKEKGSTLQSIISKYSKKNDDMDDDTFLTIITNLLNAVDDLHHRNILHLDIKPENIWINKDESVILLDFGLACITDSSKSCTTKGLGGTHGYINYKKHKNSKSTYTRDIYDDIYSIIKTFEDIEPLNPGAYEKYLHHIVKKVLDKGEKMTINMILSYIENKKRRMRNDKHPGQKRDS